MVAVHSRVEMEQSEYSEEVDVPSNCVSKCDCSRYTLDPSKSNGPKSMGPNQIQRDVRTLAIPMCG